MDKIALFGFLLVATTLEAIGDALVRLGINQSQNAMRALLFVAGAILLFGYGVSVNLAPVAFGRVVGLYIATLFIMWQIVKFSCFPSRPWHAGCRRRPTYCRRRAHRHPMGLNFKMRRA